jgi:hypothetical protein
MIHLCFSKRKPTPSMYENEDSLRELHKQSRNHTVTIANNDAINTNEILPESNDSTNKKKDSELEVILISDNSNQTIECLVENISKTNDNIEISLDSKKTPMNESGLDESENDDDDDDEEEEQDDDDEDQDDYREHQYYYAMEYDDEDDYEDYGYENEDESSEYDEEATKASLEL